MKNYNKTILMVALAMFCVALTGCNSNSRPSNQTDGEQYADGEVTGSQSSINTNWRYSVQEDKLNETKNYSAEINSIDGRLQFSVGDIDLWGNGSHTTVFAFGWLDDALPSWSGKSMIGLKFPGDTSWRKIPVSSKGGRAASFDIMYPKDLINLLTTNKKFVLLHANEEFEFRPNEPLDWSHGQSNTSNSIEVTTADSVASESYD